VRKALNAGIDPRAAHKSRQKTNGGQRAHSDGHPDLETAVFRSLLDSLEVGVAIAESAGQIVYANPRFAELLAGSSDEEVSGVELKSFVLATSWDQLSDALAQGVHVPTEGEMTVLPSGNGAQRIVHVSFTPHDSVNGKQTVRLVATEVTELVAANRALKQSEASLHTVSARLLQVQDEERRRMARDLHDITGQELAVCVMSLDKLKILADESGANFKKLISQSAQLLRQVESEIRTLSYLLHPPLLDEMGLASALVWFVEGFSKRTGIEVKTDIPEKLPRFAIELEIAIFRVVQEALTNVFRHSGSHRARVSISTSGSQLQATIEDEGKGIGKRKIAAAAEKRGVGIQSMRDRLGLFGGTLEFRSGHPGTKVIATIRLNKGQRSLEGQQPTLEQHFRGDEVATVTGAIKRILIADDHEVARQGLRVLLKDEGDLEICGEANDGVDAVEKARELRPDLVIMDLTMPRMNGFSAVKHIRASGANPKILIYTTHSYDGLERVAEAASCDGFVVKSNASQDLIRGVRTVLNGGKFFGAEVVQKTTAPA
jgi:two-component system, NarL family, sensor kinase